MLNFFKKIIHKNILNKYFKRVEKINNLEKNFKKLTKEELLAYSLKLKEKVLYNNSLDDILEEAFALVREVSARVLKQRHFDVQLVGGIALHEGKIAEMLTGEGKTLTATLPAYLNALKGKGVHIVTVNDYLAKRDTVWMGQIYHQLGLKTACLVHDNSFLYDPDYKGDNLILDEKRDELGSFKVFEEFLRPISRKEAYQADIIYGTNHEFGFDYLKDNLVLSLNERVQKEHYFAIIDEVDSILIDEARTPLIISAPDKEASDLYKLFAKIANFLEKEKDYLVDFKRKTVDLTESGIEKVENYLKVGNLFSLENLKLVHYLNESLKAKELFLKDRDYIVKDNEVIIVDEFTGRLLYGRRYSGGLHQALEAKEGVLIKEENIVYAQITIQNYFKLYEKIAGMTGTAQTSAEEFHKVYNLEVVSIPPNKPLIRKDYPDVIFKTKKAKYQAIVEEVKKRHQKGQPILIGTTSILNNEIISKYLEKAGIPHNILNAKYHEKEGEIIAQAGKLGQVTVATNMAGRGVDIILGGNPPNKEEALKIKKIGGLFVLGTERHEARRIDNQLRGRAGRQGDPGETQFFLSLEDDLLKIFGGETIQNLMTTLNVPENLPIKSKIISKAINQAQLKVEGINFDIRKHLLEFDDVLNKQRKAIYQKRYNILKLGEEGKIVEFLKEIFKKFETDYLFKEIDLNLSIYLGQQIVRILDFLWINHLINLEDLRESVSLRAYGQHEPIIEYRKDAYIFYQKLNQDFEELVYQQVKKILEVDLKGLINQIEEKKSFTDLEEKFKKTKRNDPCPCGSGKKFKKCHGR